MNRPPLLRLFPLIALGATLFFATPVLPQKAPADTTIAGQSYALHPIETLLAQLRQKTSVPITYRRTAFKGRLFAPTALDTVYAPLDLEEIYFLDEVALNKVVFTAEIRCTKSTFSNGLSLQKSRFLAPLDFSASQFDKHLTLRQAEFGASVLFSDADFSAVASFIEAQFTGLKSVFLRSDFSNAAYFEGAHFGGRADFQDVTFADIASFKGTTWPAGASFAGARFGSRALFWNANFAAATFATARADGEVAFNHASFTGPTSFDGFTFAQPALFLGTTFQSAVSFSGAYFRKKADFTAGIFAADLRLNAFFNKALDLRQTRIATLDLQAPNPGDSTFATGARLYLAQANYQHILVRWQQLAGHLTAVDTTSFDALEPVYAALRSHLNAQGLHRDADACFVESMEHRRRHMSWTDPGLYGLYLLQTTTGYGTAPARFAATSTGIVLLFGLLYRLGRAAFAPPAPSLLACLLFSLKTFIRYNAFSLRPSGPILWLAYIEALLGWICLGILVALLLSLFA